MLHILSNISIYYILFVTYYNISKDNKKGKVSFIVLTGKCAHPDEQTNKKFLAVFSSQNLKLIHKPFSFDINNNSVCNLFKKNILQYFARKSDYEIYCFYMLLNLLYNTSV